MQENIGEGQSAEPRVTRQLPSLWWADGPAIDEDQVRLPDLDDIDSPTEPKGLPRVSRRLDVEETIIEGIQRTWPTSSPDKDERLREKVAHYIEVARDKGEEASIDWLAAEAPNPFPSADSLGDQARSFIEVQVAGGLDTVSDQLQSGVTSALKLTATGIGLKPAEATISAGICSNLVLAPITGPLESAATFIEAAGVVIGLATGAHPLALACIKLLAHDEVPHLLSQGVVSLMDSSHTDAPQSNPQSLMMQRVHQAIEHPAPPAVPEAHHETTRDDPLWLCLGFVPKQPEDAEARSAGIGRAVRLRGPDKALVLPPGDDEFLRTLPAVLSRSTVLEVNNATAERLNLPAGHYFTVHMEGVGVRACSATSGSQAACQHPGCRTGRCVPPGSPCPCPCIVCRPLCRQPSNYDLALVQASPIISSLDDRPRD